GLRRPRPAGAAPARVPRNGAGRGPHGARRPGGPGASEVAFMRKLIGIVVFLAVAGGGLAWWYWRVQAGQATTFRTAAVERGFLEAVIGATGTLEPEQVIDVGA